MAPHMVLVTHFAALLTWTAAAAASDAPTSFADAVRYLDRVPISVSPLTLSLSAARQIQQEGDPIDALVSPLLGTQGSGINVLATVNGEVVKERAYGTADEENSLPMTTSSRTNIASVSKQFTAFVVLLLEHEGLLSLDDDVRKHVPEMPDYGKTIRLRHMVSMTSGIRDVIFLISLSGAFVFDAIPPERLIHLITLQDGLRFDPGERWEYSNSNFVLLALIVQRVAGMPFTEVLTRKVFEPLGMNDTTVYDDPVRIYSRLSQSYGTVLIVPAPGEAPVVETYNSKWLLTAIGASGIISTPSDVLKWAQNFDSNVLGGGQELINDMQSPYVFPNTSDVTYALGGQYAKGLFVRDIGGLTFYEHTGSIAGFRSILGRVPELNTTIILQATSDVFSDVLGMATSIFLTLHPDVLPSGSGDPTVSEEPNEGDTSPADYETDVAVPSESDLGTAHLAEFEPSPSSSAEPDALSPEPSDEDMGEEQMFASLSEAEYRQKAGVWMIKDSTDLYFDMSVNCTDDENLSQACALKINLGSFTETFLRPVSELVWVGHVLGVDRALTVTFDDSQPTAAGLVLTFPGVGEYEASATRNPVLQLSEEELRRYEGMFFSKELDVVYKSVVTDHGLEFGVDAGVVDMPAYLPCCSESSFNGSFIQALPRPIAGPLQADTVVLTLHFEIIDGAETISFSANESAFPRSHFQDIVFRRIDSCLV